MARLQTPLANIDLHPEGERQCERALQTGERYNFKFESSGQPCYFTGTIKRSKSSPTDFVLVMGKP